MGILLVDNYALVDDDESIESAMVDVIPKGNCVLSLLEFEIADFGPNTQGQFAHPPFAAHDCTRKDLRAVQINPMREFAAIIPVLEVDLGADVVNVGNVGAGRRALRETTRSKQQQGDMSVNLSHK